MSLVITKLRRNSPAPNYHQWEGKLIYDQVNLDLWWQTFFNFYFSYNLVFTAKSYDPFDQVKIRFWNQVLWISELLFLIALKMFNSKITLPHFQDQSVLNNFASDYIEKRFTPGSVRYKMDCLTKITKHLFTGSRTKWCQLSPQGIFLIILKILTGTPKKVFKMTHFLSWTLLEILFL